MTLLRPAEQPHATVGYAELFFDLVYVFAVTQLSHFLLAHHDAAGVARGAVLFLAVWWAWTYMAWATNWLDPDRFTVRVALFATMLAGLVMSISLPAAFGAGGAAFALAYAGSQVLRTAFLVMALRGERPALARSMMRALVWFAFAAPLWLAGAFAGPDTRLLLWAVAISLELAAPALLFRVPGLGRSRTEDFGVSGGHMAERSALFIIVALGEGVVVTGTTVVGMRVDAATVAAFLTAFAGSVAMWWIYFDRGMARGAAHIAHHRDSGRVARTAYSYLHLPIVGGIIVGAVGDELLLAHPLGHADALFLATTAGGAALFLTGCLLFKRATTGLRLGPLSHLAGLALLAAIALWGVAAHPAPLAIGIATVVTLAIVAIWEWGSFHGGWTSRPAPGATT